MGMKKDEEIEMKTREIEKYEKVKQIGERGRDRTRQLFGEINQSNLQQDGGHHSYSPKKNSSPLRNSVSPKQTDNEFVEKTVKKHSKKEESKPKWAQS